MHSGWSAQVGRRLFDKLRKKNDKQVEVKKSVRTDMRRLAQLYEEPRDSSRWGQAITVQCKIHSKSYNTCTFVTLFQNGVQSRDKD